LWRWDNQTRMNHDDSAVGATGVVTVSTRGRDGPGEVLLSMRGGTESYLAYSEEPLPRGSRVLVFNARGERSVDVMQFDTEPDP
jgi:hypothetical protein